MQKISPRKMLLTMAVLASVGGGLMPARLAQADDGVSVSGTVQQAVKSLVSVEYTFRTENNSSQEGGQGIVISIDGLVLMPGTLFPENVPQSYIKDLKIRASSKNYSAVSATFLGRSPGGLFAFIKAEKPLGMDALDLSKTATAKLGDGVFGAGILSKSGNYEPYTNINTIRAILPAVHDLYCTQTFGLTRTNSPVFDLKTGALVGVTVPPLGESVVVQAEFPGRGPATFRSELRDQDQTGVFVGADYLLDAIEQVKQINGGSLPSKPFVTPRPWLGLDGITGLDEDLRNLNNIKEIAGVVVGSVVPGAASDKAGIKSRDIIVGINGKPFSTTSVSEYMTQHFQRKLEHVKPGDKVTLTVVRVPEGSSDAQRIDIPVTIDAMPKLGADLPMVFNPRLGVSSRDLVFFDTYARKLPATTKGVMITLVKNGSPAALGDNPVRPGLIIQKVNDTPVDNEAQFDDALKDAVSPDKKEVVLVALDPRGDTSVLRVDLTAEPKSTKVGE